MYETSIHLVTLIDALNIIAKSKPGDNYRLTLNTLLKIENGKIFTINDEFVIKNAVMIKDEMKVNLSIDLTIKAFIEQLSEGKILLLKGENGSPFIEIKVINKQLALIRF